MLDGAVAGEHRHFVEVIDRNVRRALRLVDELSGEDYGARPATPTRMQQTRVDLRRVIGDAVNDAIQGSLLEHHRVGGLGHPEPVFVVGDRDRLSEVFDNLLHNAVAYTPRGGTITVGIDLYEEGVLAWVRDTGCGIPDEECDRVFEPLYRGAEAVRCGIPGTGIGLAVVREVAQAHGGVAGLESEVGRGTRVWVRLPHDEPRGLRAFGGGRGAQAGG